MIRGVANNRLNVSLELSPLSASEAVNLRTTEPTTLSSVMATLKVLFANNGILSLTSVILTVNEQKDDNGIFPPS